MEPNCNKDQLITEDLIRVSNVFELHTITDKKDDLPINESQSMDKEHYYWKAFLGITMGLLSGASIAIYDAFALMCIKIGYSPSQVILVKSLMMMAITIPLLVYKTINIVSLRRQDTLLNIAKSICENAGSLFFYYGMSNIGVGDASSIASGTTPIFTPLFACIFIQETFKFHDCVSVVTNVIGIVLISHPNFIFDTNTNAPPLGYVYAFLAGILLAIGAVCSRAMSHGLSLIVVVFYNGLCGTIIMLILVYPTSNDRIYTLIPECPIAIAYLVGVVAFFVAFLYSFNRSLQLQSAGKTTILFNISIVTGFAADVIVFHKQIVDLEIIGAALIILSSIIVFLITCFEMKHRVGEETNLLEKPK
ncbi:solute carrier family 35 member G1-like [Saccoglossus kowalevskii]|uniref:Solute carrier family 35 member G3-like n=1 Tax=Saccoglossus kowalevskii TaxID=10224 RepID=A0ABM0MWZ6_SACKO|nr:PREDICTED: solute carrier family 35 member G3-like [Saccoglossus kowalevskii]